MLRADESLMSNVGQSYVGSLHSQTRIRMGLNSVLPGIA